MRYAKKMAVAVCVLAGALSITGIAGEQPVYTAEDIAKAKPTATIEVEAEQVRLILGGAQGKGVLRFEGKNYPFKVKGMSVGGIGVTKVHGTGDVYFLKSPADLSGTYSAVSAGMTLGAGAGGSQYQNGKGVFISMKSKTEGVGLSLGAGGIQVTLD